MEVYRGTVFVVLALLSLIALMNPRQRNFQAGHTYHVLNRGALRQTLFTEEAAYRNFESLMLESLAVAPLSILTYALMPNHWHFLVQPKSKEELSSFFQYLAGTHAKRFRVATSSRGEGHVYQDRFKSFPVQSDGHFLCVARYVERNSLRANLVTRAEHWRWSGLWHRLHGSDEHLSSSWPVERPDDWIERVNQPLTAAELNSIHTSIRRGRPYGDRDWEDRVARELGLQHSLRATGRPRKCAGESQRFSHCPS